MFYRTEPKVRDAHELVKEALYCFKQASIATDNISDALWDLEAVIEELSELHNSTGR